MLMLLSIRFYKKISKMLQDFLQDILVDSLGESSCDFTTCAAAPTAAAVEAFAASNDVWIPEFTKVFTKMQAHGNFTLNDLS